MSFGSVVKILTLCSAARSRVTRFMSWSMWSVMIALMIAFNPVFSVLMFFSFSVVGFLFHFLSIVYRSFGIVSTPIAIFYNFFRTYVRIFPACKVYVYTRRYTLERDCAKITKMPALVF